jgi:hypothetical protein
MGMNAGKDYKRESTGVEGTSTAFLNSVDVNKQSSSIL